MRPKFRTLFLCLFLMASVLGLSVFAKDDPTQKTRLEKSKGTLQDPGDYMVLNINNWVLFLEANGRSGYDPFHSGDGPLSERHFVDHLSRWLYLRRQTD
jgi:hypothetical protein